MKIKLQDKPILSFPKATIGRVLEEKVFLVISQNSQENTCARVFLNKRPANL